MVIIPRTVDRLLLMQMMLLMIKILKTEEPQKSVCLETL